MDKEVKMKSFNNLDAEEQYLFEAVISARKVQEFLWGDFNEKWDLEEWKRMFKKRLVKVDDIDSSNPHAMIELRKRILQNTALGIALLYKIDNQQIQEECNIPSNLPEYASK
jgi:hypothetical protein